VGVVEASTRALNLEAPAGALNAELPVPVLIPEPPRVGRIEAPPLFESRSPQPPPPAFHELDEPDELPQLMPAPFAGTNSLRELSMVVGLLDEATPEPPSAAKITVPLKGAVSGPAARTLNPEPAAGSPRQAVAPSNPSPATQVRELPLVDTQAELQPAEARRPERIALTAGTAIAAKRVSLAAPRGTPHGTPVPLIAPLANYSPLAGRPLRPAIPPRTICKSDSEACFTLPGPMLTARLQSFKDRELRPILKDRKRGLDSSILSWAVRGMIVAVVLVLGWRIGLAVLPEKAAPNPAPTATATAVPASVSASVPAATVANPLSKAIEVTGFRIVVNPYKKSEIQYLVVNHTPARFSNVTVYVTLRSADAKPGQPPLCRFSFAAPNLAAFQSKEMSSSIEKMNRPVALPDWQDLRADIEIGQ
jgi:hypothetical protein